MEEQLFEGTISVLYIDDEQSNLDAFSAVFRRNFDIHLAINGVKAKEILSSTDIHVIVTDQRMPQMLGTELLEYAYLNYPLPSRILLTAFADHEVLNAAIKRGKICSYLKKPWNELELIGAINEAFETYKMKKEREEISKELRSTNLKLEELLKSKINSF